MKGSLASPTSFHFVSLTSRNCLWLLRLKQDRTIPWRPPSSIRRKPTKLLFPPRSPITDAATISFPVLAVEESTFYSVKGAFITRSTAETAV